MYMFVHEFDEKSQSNFHLMLSSISLTISSQPFDHEKKVAKFYWATPELVAKAIETSLEAKKEWERVPLQDRMDLFLKVADQMANEYRADLNATTMLGQAKTVIQGWVQQSSLSDVKSDLGRI